MAQINGEDRIEFLMDFYGPVQFSEMLRDFMQELAPDLEIDRNNPASILKLCFIKNWLAPYNRWLDEMVETVKYFKAHAPIQQGSEPTEVDF